MLPTITVLSPSQRASLHAAAARNLDRIRQSHAASAGCHDPVSPSSTVRSPSNRKTDQLKLSSAAPQKTSSPSSSPRNLSPCAFPGAYLPYICSLAHASAGRTVNAYHCLQDAASAVEPAAFTNQMRARLHHNIATHAHLLHAVLKMQGVPTSSHHAPCALSTQDGILQLLQQHPHESRLYLALVLLYAAAGSWDAAAALLKTCLKMLPDWTEGSVMLGCVHVEQTTTIVFVRKVTASTRYVLRRGGHSREALAIAQGLLLRSAPPILTSVCLAANCYITSCYYEQAFQLLTKMRAACSKGTGPYDAPVLCNYGVSAAACGIGASAAVAALHQAVTLSRSTPCISHTRLHQDICCCACVVVAGVMKRESYVLIPATDSTGRTLHSSVEWDAFLTELECSVADAHGCSGSGSSCLGSGMRSHDQRLSDKALVALALIQYRSHP